MSITNPINLAPTLNANKAELIGVINQVQALVQGENDASQAQLVDLVAKVALSIAQGQQHKTDIETSLNSAVTAINQLAGTHHQALDNKLVTKTTELLSAVQQVNPLDCKMSELPLLGLGEGYIKLATSNAILNAGEHNFFTYAGYGGAVGKAATHNTFSEVCNVAGSGRFIGLIGTSPNSGGDHIARITIDGVAHEINLGYGLGKRAVLGFVPSENTHQESNGGHYLYLPQSLPFALAESRGVPFNSSVKVEYKNIYPRGGHFDNVTALYYMKGKYFS